jgi:hypothetical protein
LLNKHSILTFLAITSFAVQLGTPVGKRKTCTITQTILRASLGKQQQNEHATNDAMEIITGRHRSGSKKNINKE